MSVINQVLLDLEKRRASSAERGTVPNHVRALPDDARPTHWAWIAGGAAAVMAAAAAAWMLLAGSSAIRVNPPAARSGAEVVIEKVVTASAGVTPTSKPDDEVAVGSAPASRLTFELANVPDAAELQREEPAPGKRVASAPLATSRVIGRSDPEPVVPDAQPAARRGARPQHAAGEKSAAAALAGTEPEIKKQVRQPTSRDLAENEYRKAIALMHQGRLAEAQEGYEAALTFYPEYHAARQALVGVLVESKKLPEAERVLQDGFALAPAQIGFAMALARLQVDRGDVALAAATLRKGIDYAQGSPDYIAFFAALLQRQGRHEEAIEQFQVALRAKPTSGVWWLGLGISLQSANRAVEAQDAFRRARATNNLSPELAAFAEQRLRQLQ